MERLTHYETPEKHAYVDRRLVSLGWYSMTDGGFRGPAIDRLAAYEDTGWTPEEIEEFDQGLLEAYKETGLEPEEIALYKEAQEISESMAPGRLIELAQAELDGRLVVIPRPPQDGDNAVLAAVFRGQERPVVMHGGGDIDDLIALTHLLVSYTAEVTGVSYAEFCQGMGEMEPTTGFEQREEEKNADPPD